MMGRREGQERVEVRPDVFLWLNEADRKALPPAPEASRQDVVEELTPAKEPAETTTAQAPEKATMPKPRTRKRG